MSGSIRVVLAILVATALGACSNTGSPASFAPGEHGAGNRTATSELVLRVRIPKRTKAHRGAQYISAATKGLTMSFTGRRTFTQVVNLTPADPRCSGSPLVCTNTIDLAAGSYSVSVNAYDEAPVDGAIPAGAKVLSTAAGIRFAVKRGITNTLGLTLDGVPASILVASFAPVDAGSGFSNKSFSVTVSDADGYTIVGTYGTPVVLSDGDTTGATAVTSSGSDNPPARTLLSSGDTAALSYSGKSIVSARITATAGSVSGFSVFEVSAPSPTPSPVVLSQGAVIGEDNQFTPNSGDTASGGNGQQIDGIPCAPSMTLNMYHVHAYLGLLVNGTQIAVPDQIGLNVPGPIQSGFTATAQCYYEIHMHDTSGMIHIESPSTASLGSSIYTLGTMLDVWGMPVGPNGVGPFSGTVRAFVDHTPLKAPTADSYTEYTGDPNTIPIYSHEAIWLEVGPTYVLPPNIPAVEFYTEY